MNESGPITFVRHDTNDVLCVPTFESLVPHSPSMTLVVPLLSQFFHYYLNVFEQAKFRRLGRSDVHAFLVVSMTMARQRIRWKYQ
jgi:hypothetical protein